MATGSNRDEGALSFPHPTDPLRTVAWNGAAFDVDGHAVRVLAYDVSASGWTDQLTHLLQEVAGSDHFIDVASRMHAVDEVTRCAGGRPSTILEIGCSSGFLLRELVARLPRSAILGSDYTRGTLEALAPRMSGIPLIQFDLTRCPLPDEVVDVAVLLNVLEHIGDHGTAVAQLFRIIRPGGAVVIEVPAGSSLFDVYDRLMMHQRRYDMPDLICLLCGAGFIIERRSHLGFFLYPLFYLTKRLNQFRHPERAAVNKEALVRGMIAVTRKSSPIMSLVMGLERILRSFVYLPRGVRCLVTCRKPMSRT
jgi:SAM-dependent methyltransferase